MLYLVCRADQVPAEFKIDRPVEFKPSLEYYPRIVHADSPTRAIEVAFHPERYKPAGKRELLAIELGEIHYLVAEPNVNYTVIEKKVSRADRKLKVF